jgi:hypothetical protein
MSRRRCRPEQGFIGGWLSKRAVDKSKNGKSAYIRNYSWKPRYFRQTETGNLAFVAPNLIKSDLNILIRLYLHSYCVDRDPSKPPKGEIKMVDIKYVYPRKESDRFVIVTKNDQGTYQTVQVRSPSN